MLNCCHHPRGREQNLLSSTSSTAFPKISQHLLALQLHKCCHIYSNPAIPNLSHRTAARWPTTKSGGTARSWSPSPIDPRHAGCAQSGLRRTMTVLGGNRRWCAIAETLRNSTEFMNSLYTGISTGRCSGATYYAYHIQSSHSPAAPA